MSRQVTPRTTLDNLKREAKRWLKALRTNVVEARERLERSLPNAPASPTLRDVQHALAVEHGLPGWTALQERLAEGAVLRRYDRVAEALVLAYRTGEASAMRVVWDCFGHMRPWDGMRRYVRLGLGRSEVPAAWEADEISLIEARSLVARAQGFESWLALEQFATAVPRGKPVAAKVVETYSIDSSGSTQVSARSRDWDEIIGLMREQRSPGLNSGGQMTDDLLERFTRLDHITMLHLDGSKELTDRGLRHLARLPGLRHLNLSGCGITDRGLEVLRKLPELESLSLQWTGVTDAGAAHLAACDRLQIVDLSGTASGDGAIRALDGKGELHHFSSGSQVTDAGLALLHRLPVFTSWQGRTASMALLDFDAGPNYLLLRGSFTDRGLAQLVGLDGLFALNLDSDRLALTGAALAPLVQLAHLGWLAFDAKDESMSYIAALPRLRFLMCQDTTAADAGFVALSRSQSIEHIWGRRCHNLQRRGFEALADMPALAHLSVSCKNVDDAGLAALPRFPALRELMPMDVPDEGYRHIGRCERLESLVLMYCRETTDAATEHIVGLAKLKKYFASYNRITDRTPELLSGMESLEEITFDTCTGVSSDGIAALARLPRLGKLVLDGMPKVGREVTSAFAPGVQVNYSP